ncbi:hypothetical protein BDZ97DRAFT_1907423 [Flammula alnicola]|nr:hypothetical protein BDZ97DRAFT_1907423 [Flammula alnicola]
MSTKAQAKITLAPQDNPETVTALQEVQQSEVKRYTTVKNTEKAYNGHLTRARKFLENLVAKRRANGEGKICAAGIQTDELAKALDGDKPPNRYSALAVELFLTQRCLVEGLGVSTAEGIHGALCTLWDKMDGDRYAGKYELNEATGEVRGCPARAPSVTDVLYCIKIRAKSRGASAVRNHADAMTIEEIQTLMRWSTSICPDEMLTADPKTITNMEDLMFRLEHGFMRAFMSSAFTLWTRCFELASLQAQDIELDCRGPAPYYAPHFKVHLNHRKGWQQEKGYDGPRTSNVYDIYKQDIPEIDMFTHVIRWKTFLENYLGVPLGPKDCLFPHLAVNGVIRGTRAMSYDSLQALLARFCDGAGIQKRYTTHSFRRGGAQYRFMFAPIGMRWSLNMIRWWGGWAVGEHVDTLIKYLVDSLQSFENGHGDALHPVPIQPTMSFMGDHVAAGAVTGVEFRQFGHSVNRKFDDLVTLITSAPRLAKPNVNERAAPTRPDTQDYNKIQGITYQYQLADMDTTSAIPRLPKVSIAPLGRERGAWRRAIAQWEEVDPVTGLALKDWPSEWYRDDQRLKVGSLRSQRQIIFEEFERLGRDNDLFLAKYPDADKSLAKLLSAIRYNNGARRSSKNRIISPKKLNNERRHPHSSV